MDTQAKEIIVQAFREGNFLSGIAASTGEEMQEALPRLNTLLFSLIGLELGEKYREWAVPPSRTSSVPSRYPLAPINEDHPQEVWANPPVNSRLVVSNKEPITLYFPQAPTDGARMAYVDAGALAPITIDGNGRLVQGVASIAGQGGAKRWLYRADQGNWVCLEKLTLESTMPLPPEFDDLFISGLVIKLCPRFEKSPAAEVVQCYGDMLSRLKKRYAQTEAAPTTLTPHEFPRMLEI